MILTRAALPVEGAHIRPYGFSAPSSMVILLESHCITSLNGMITRAKNLEPFPFLSLLSLPQRGSQHSRKSSHIRTGRPVLEFQFFNL